MASDTNAVSPADGWQTTTLPLSNSVHINAVMNDEGVKWGGTGKNGVTISYSFPWANGEPSFAYTEDAGAAGAGGFSAQQQGIARLAMSYWSNVANVTFVEVADTDTSVGIIRFGFSSSTGAGVWGHAYLPDSSGAHGGDIWVNPDFNKDWKVVSYDTGALTHEIGHALGLKHPFDGNTKMPAELDFENYTLMSYTSPAVTFYNDPLTGESIYPINKPMVYDILAIQYMYGANMSYRTGSDTYTYSSSTAFFDTIWDAGGHDVLDLSGFTADNVINLRAGSYSSVRLTDWNVTDNLGIAFGVTIEDANGGSGNDTIFGNEVNNALRGNSGNDILYGRAGQNTLDGGAGLDMAGYEAARDGYAVTRASGNLTVTAKDGSAVDTATNIERLKFSDGILAFDTGAGENAGSAYRLYQAAFDRVPDTEGLSYWIRETDKGVKLNAIAESFLASPEFVSTYGTDQTVSNTKYIELLYTHTLGRNYDQSGFDYWVERLDASATNRGDLLAFFSESDENNARVATNIADGIWHV